MITKITKGIIILPAYILTVVTVAIVLYLTLAPDPFNGAQPVALFPGADKVVHAIMMAGVYLCMAVDHMRRGRQWCRLSTPAYWIIYIIVVAFGGAIELAQGVMDMGRGCDLLDFVADIAGTTVAAVTLSLLPWPQRLTGAKPHPEDRG
ncbi:MAG: hypothetical protein K2L49_09685 [Muribaculaceae bacterium]|nr:hypothetical protein [Muribaculaceae bacterium]